MSNLNLLIGKRIKDLRIKQGLSQEELSVQVGLSRSYISRVESGISTLSIERLGLVINKLGVTVEEFFTFSEKRIELKYTPSIISIINVLSKRSTNEQKYILNYIKSLFKFKDKI